MAFEGNTGLQVATQYGARNTGVSIGAETTKTAFNILSIELTGKGLAEKFIPPFVLPKGASIKRAVLSTDEVFSGLTTVTIGEGKAEATNGIALAAADFTLGTRDVTAKLVGTWAADKSVAKAAITGMVVAGTVLPTQGKASLVVEYVYKRRNDNEWAADPATRPAYRPQR